MQIDPELTEYLATTFPNDFDDDVDTRIIQDARMEVAGDGGGAPTSVTLRDQEIPGPESGETSLFRIYRSP